VGLRETLNENPGLTTAATAVIILAAIVFMVVSMFRGDPETAGASGSVTKEFFSDDDGKTFFEDDRTKIPPFDRNGKTAYRARVFTCDGGKTKFVGWLERYTPQAKKTIEDQMKNAGSGPILLEDQSGLQIKKPGTGDKGWLSSSDVATIQIRDVQCPNGSPADLVTPP
jgi:hypothetical protein